MRRPSVLMVTGSYYPELSGAGLQCRALIRALGDRVRASVLTTTADRRLDGHDEMEGVSVFRLYVEVERRCSKLWAALRLAWWVLRRRGTIDVIHCHGVSQKTWVVIWVARLLRTPVIIKLTSIGHDDPLAIRERGWWAWQSYRQADVFIGVSEGLAARYRASGLPPEKFRLIPNGVDVARFHPSSPEERVQLRGALGLPAGRSVMLCVGFFSQEKRPHLLFEAWSGLQRNGVPSSTLVFVGATRGRYYEIDPTLAEGIRQAAGRLGLGEAVRFVESTSDIDAYYRAADCFVMPSSREGLPNALLEAMASGLPCIAARLDGVTDIVIEHGRNGLLVPVDDVSALSAAIRRILHDPVEAARLGVAAHRTMTERYALPRIADRYDALYHHVASNGVP